MDNIQFYYQQTPLTITAASQMPIITSGRTGIMTTENEQKIDQEGGNSITNDNASVDQLRPSPTYMSLIAIFAAPGMKRPVNDIYIWIANTYPFYKMENKDWKNAIRHNLSLCPAFCRCERDDGKKAWTIPDEYLECFVDGVYSDYKMKKIKARKTREENASTFESGETIGSSSNGTVKIQQSDVPKLTPPSQESLTNQLQFPRLFSSSPNLSTAPTQSISSSGSMRTPRRSEIALQGNSYLNVSETSSSSSPAPCNHVNMAVENIQDNGILNYEIKETEIEIPYCCETGLEYDQQTYFDPEIYDFQILFTHILDN
ncbi:hypothetical protein Glove_551g29 [Diversispora epigaea]|uniref:Fork-head domain-containing protein n=1 Tax=Diversispora epigaea TaxID=1348612 RepID=A0A397GHD2_9GLOM|nr:hypothetical protein Glove_551g29 [Diversispora epigaea]